MTDKVTQKILDNKPPDPYTRREYLTFAAMLDGAPWYLAIESVASTALAHPEWDMDETKTLEEWLNERDRG